MNAHKATITSIFDGTTLIEIPFFSTFLRLGQISLGALPK